MKKPALLAIVGASLLGVACSITPDVPSVVSASTLAKGSIVGEDEYNGEAAKTSLDPSTEPPACLETAESVGVATSASTLSTGCRAACAIPYALGCVSVGVACSGATTITLGGTTIPCAWAIIAACGVIAPGGAQICMSYCPS